MVQLTSSHRGEILRGVTKAKKYKEISIYTSPRLEILRWSPPKVKRIIYMISIAHSNLLAMLTRQNRANAYLDSTVHPNSPPSDLSPELLWDVSYAGMDVWIERHKTEEYFEKLTRVLFEKLRPVMQLAFWDLLVSCPDVYSMRNIIALWEISTHGMRPDNAKDQSARMKLQEVFISRALYLAWRSSHFDLKALRDGLPTFNLWELSDEELLSSYEGLWSASKRRSNDEPGRREYAPEVLKQLFKGLKPSRQLELLVEVEKLYLQKAAMTMLATAILEAPHVDKSTNTWIGTAVWSEDKQDLEKETEIQEEMFRRIKRFEHDGTKLSLPCPESPVIPDDENICTKHKGGKTGRVIQKLRRIKALLKRE